MSSIKTQRIMNKRAGYFGKIKGVFQHILHTPVHLMYVYLAIPMVVIFSATVPLFAGYDEEFHVVRAWSVGTLKLYPSYEDSIPKSLADSIDYSMSLKPDYGNNINPTSFLFRKNYNAHLNNPESEYHRYTSAKLDANIQTDSAGRSTGPYPPIAYVPSAVGFALSEKFNLSVGWSIFIARALSGLACVVIMAFALFFTRNYKFKWVIFSVALLPSVLFQFSTVTADSYTIAVAAFMIAVAVSAILSQEKRLSRSRLIVVGVSSFLLSFVKINYVPFALVFMAIPLNKLHTSRKIAVAIRIALTFTPIIIATVLLLMYGSKDYYINHSNIAGLDSHGQLVHVLGAPLEFAKVSLDTIYINSWSWLDNIFGAFGWLAPAGPGGIGILLSFLALAIASAYAFVEFNTKTIIYFWIIGTLSAGSILLSLYMAYTPLGHFLINGIQGRYFIPVLILLGIASARLIGIKIHNSKDRVPYIIPALITVSLIITLVTTYRTLY